jgi:ribosome-associated protein
MRTQGTGGHNVHRVSSAVHLRPDIRASSLPECYRKKRLQRNDLRFSGDGCMAIQAQQYRSQEMNRADALARLRVLVNSVAVVCKARKAAIPAIGSQKRRRDSKSRQGRLQASRRWLCNRLA